MYNFVIFDLGTSKLTDQMI